MLSPADIARLGACIADGRAAGPEWTDWLLDEMRAVRGTGDFGVRKAFPAAERKTIAIKNGWVDRQAEQEYHVSCLAIGDGWAIGVMARYEINRGYPYGAGICEQVGEQLRAELTPRRRAQPVKKAGPSVTARGRRPGRPRGRRIHAAGHLTRAEREVEHPEVRGQGGRVEGLPRAAAAATASSSSLARSRERRNASCTSFDLPRMVGGEVAPGGPHGEHHGQPVHSRHACPRSVTARPRRGASYIARARRRRSHPPHRPRAASRQVGRAGEGLGATASVGPAASGPAEPRCGTSIRAPPGARRARPAAGRDDVHRQDGPSLPTARSGSSTTRRRAGGTRPRDRPDIEPAVDQLGCSAAPGVLVQCRRPITRRSA